MRQTIQIISLATALLLGSCAGGGLEPDGAMFFKVDAASLAGEETKSAPIGSYSAFKGQISSFGLKIYESGSLIGSGPTKATLDGDEYVPDKKYFWIPGTTLDIYAYSPESVSIVPVTAEGKVTFSYTLDPATAPKNMPDVMLARYNGTGNNGEAELKFFHALTAVSFVSGKMVDMTINSITITGVNSSGNCTATFGATSPFEPTFAWTSNTPTAFGCTLGVPVDVTFTGAQKSINAGADTFILIPQTLPAGAKLTLGITMASSTNSISCSLAGKEWKAGTHYTYKVNYVEGLMSIEMINVNDWTGTDHEIGME